MSNVLVTPQTKLGLFPNVSSGTITRVKYASARENLRPLGEARRGRKKETVLKSGLSRVNVSFARSTIT